VSLAWSAVGVGAAVPADTTPPTVAITAPANNAKVAAGFQVQVNTADNNCINKVELLIDGQVAQTLTAAPFTFTTDAATITSGSHMIQVKSYDAFSSSAATASLTVTGGGGGTGGGTGGGDGDVNNSDDVTGGCSTGGNGAAGSLALLFATAFALRRRRAR